ncbi:hypothetical protein, conserved [Trypanosoma brucei brucei TREU927]|uniref:Uncharacterized protein n=1 Tax=Trypanosoma brucei brucei (strain 927/4 GUTat10.1) TaxID=185431 RepID=Q38E74_TRYB2|nr:hypothetical protein, conserved [Trypanosoma brucei brucei TREU927]EAN76896.1 hypothetical protein, conserved [Trypanosoma brucei brucei TREU927]
MAKDSEKSPMSLHTGDVLLMDRNCWEMRHPLGIAICLLSKTESRYDHVAMVVKLNDGEVERGRERGIINPKDPSSPSGTYVAEANLSGFSLRPLENRVARSSSKHIAVRPLSMGSDMHKFEEYVQSHLRDFHSRPYKRDLLMFPPMVLSPPDKMDRIKAAHKLNLLKGETSDIDKLLAGKLSESDKEALLRIKVVYHDAAQFLIETYFAHLDRVDGESFPSVDYGGSHFTVDGVNAEEEVVCTELIIQLWQRCGVVDLFPPASSFRSFDFLDNTRFNFKDARTAFGDVFTLKGNDAPETPIKRATRKKTPTVEGCFDVYRSTSANGDPHNPDVDSMYMWLIQSNTNKVVNSDLGLNIASVGALFALCGLVIAPLRLRWIEYQLGVVLRRGSVWSLSAGFFARDMLCVLTQVITTSIALKSLLYRQSDTGPLGPPLVHTHLFDTRHPYYYVCIVWLLANAVAHITTTPLLNSVVAHHFGPVLPGPLSLRKLMRGSFALLPLGALLPFQAAWITWYETMGAAIIPTSSSVLRRRADLLDTDEWRHFRFEALTGAFAATTALDFIAYIFQRRCWRSFLVQLYRPAATPSCGRRRCAGYGYRFLGNTITMLTTSLSLSFLGVL